MVVLCGTLDGLFRSPDVTFERVDRVLDGRSDAYSFAAVDGVFARSGGDLYWSGDSGQTWTAIPSPPDDITAVQASPDGTELFVGTYPPAKLYTCSLTDQSGAAPTDDDPDWQQLADFPAFEPVLTYDPEHDRTETVREDGGAIHDLRAHPGDPNTLVAGIEPAGIFRSTDRGRTWTARRDGVHWDVHDIALTGPDEFVVATGQGLYSSRDGGVTWRRLDVRQTYFEYTYFHDVAISDGVVYAGAAAGSPGDWDGEYGANAVLLRADHLGAPLHHESYPGGPNEIPLSVAVVEGRVLAGTMAQDWDAAGTEPARVIERIGDGNWRTTGTIPAGVISLVSV